METNICIYKIYLYFILYFILHLYIYIIKCICILKVSVGRDTDELQRWHIFCFDG